jgi:hypothetical protein
LLQCRQWTYFMQWLIQQLNVMEFMCCFMLWSSQVLHRSSVQGFVVVAVGPWACRWRPGLGAVVLNLWAEHWPGGCGVLSIGLNPGHGVLVWTVALNLFMAYSTRACTRTVALVPLGWTLTLELWGWVMPWMLTQQLQQLRDSLSSQVLPGELLCWLWRGSHHGAISVSVGLGRWPWIQHHGHGQ